jgi:hypothetical protein
LRSPREHLIVHLRRTLLTVLVVTATAQPAFAAPEARRSVRLDYENTSASTSCPGPEALRASIESRLGYDPFVEADADALVVRIADAPDGLAATVRIAGGADRDERRIVSKAKDCYELHSGVALSASVVLDPMSVLRPPPEPTGSAGAIATPSNEPAPSVATAPAVEPLPARDARPNATEPSKAPDASVRTRLRATAAAHVAVASAPVPAFGVTAGLAARRGWASLKLEGRADLPAGTTDTTGRGVESSLLLATLAPCAHRARYYGCALVSAGTLLGRGLGVDSPLRDRTFYAAAGLRLGVEVPLTPEIGLLAQADALGTLRQTTLQINGREVWTTPPLSAAFAIGAKAEF